MSESEEKIIGGEERIIGISEEPRGTQKELSSYFYLQCIETR